MLTEHEACASHFFSEEDAQARFAEELRSHGLLGSPSAPGLVERSRAFEEVVVAVDQRVRGLAIAGGAQERFFPPVVPAGWLVAAGYVEKFPHLLGVISSFTSGNATHAKLVEAASSGGDWAQFLDGTELALCPAACYPLYPSLRGMLGPGGARVTLSSFIFRREPSADPARLQSFRQREDIRVGTLDEILSWRANWLERAGQLFAALGLGARAVVASDPFFGRAGLFLEQSQRMQELKFEFEYPITSAEKPTAIASLNYHREHFAEVFGIRNPDGSVAQSACIGFGLERIALALFKQHGFEREGWPTSVKNELFAGGPGATPFEPSRQRSEEPAELVTGREQRSTGAIR